MQPIDLNRPLTGYYKTKLVKGGPFVPARIFRNCCCTVNGGDDNIGHPWRMSCDRFPQLRAEVDGQARDPFQIWSWVAKHPITEAEFRYMTDMRDWAEENAPALPEADPRTPVDIDSIPPMF